MNYLNRKPLIKIFLASIFVFIFLLVMLKFGIKNFKLLINPKLATPVSPVYYIKAGRESLQSLFVFGNEDLANWYFDLATKRIKEAKILQQHDFSSLAYRQIDLAQYYQDQGFKHLKPLIDVVDTNFLKEKFESNKQEINKF